MTTQEMSVFEMSSPDMTGWEGMVQDGSVLPEMSAAPSRLDAPEETINFYDEESAEKMMGKDIDLVEAEIERYGTYLH